MDQLIFTLWIGTGATAVMDVWGVVRKSLFGIPSPNYAMVGRWIAHMRHWQFRHVSIAASSPKREEHILGWTAHYLIGISFAALLVGIWGDRWVDEPSLGPAIAVGLGTVAAPFLIMQPGMGAGIAASRTQAPNSARLQSIITHAIFGLGLYVSGWAAQLSNSI